MGEEEGEFAIVEGVGAKVDGVKVGSTVVVERYARRAGIKIGDLRIVGKYYIKATVTS